MNLEDDDTDLEPERLPYLECQNRNPLGMDPNDAERAAKRVMIHLYRGNIAHAHAALDDAWETHRSIGEPISLDDPIATVIPNDERLLNILDSHQVKTVKDLRDVTQKMVVNWENAGWEAWRKVRNVKEEIDKRLPKKKRGEQPEADADNGEANNER